MTVQPTTPDASPDTSADAHPNAHPEAPVSVIATDGLTMRFGSVTALDQLSMSVGAGVSGLVGANGAGKSTLIKILLGLLPATAGTAEVLGLDCVTHGGQVRGLVGYMPEHDCLPTDISATEFVVHMAQMSGLPVNAARERTADTLRHVGMYEERYRPIGGYSTGMRQRVKLAQALVHDPKLIFLDEPTNGLDPQGRDEMLALIRRIGAEFGIPVLVTSHLLGELERISDHVVVIDAGRLLRSSATTEYTQATRMLAVEVVDPADGSGGDVLGRQLTEQGLQVRSDGNLLHVAITDEATFDRVRDTTARLGLGLIRMEQGRHRIEDVFADSDHHQVGSSPAAAPTGRDEHVVAE